MAGKSSGKENVSQGKEKTKSMSQGSEKKGCIIQENEKAEMESRTAEKGKEPQEVKKRVQVQLPCEIVGDLLPIYHDKAVSAETEEAVRAHLSSCEACREEYRLLCGELPEEGTDIGGSRALFERTMRRQKRRRRLQAGMIAALSLAAGIGLWLFLTTIPIVKLSPEEVTVSHVYRYDDTGNQGILFIVSFPTYDYCRIPLEKERGGVIEGYAYHPILCLNRLRQDASNIEEATCYMDYQMEGDEKQVFFCGKELWKEGDGIVNELPAYLTEYLRFKEDSGENQMWWGYDNEGFFFMQDENGKKLIVWDLDGNVLTETPEWEALERMRD